MTRKTKKTLRKISPKRRIKTTSKVQKDFFGNIKLTESYTSLILGAIAVVIIGILFISFAKGNRNLQTSSIMDTPKNWKDVSQDSNTSSIYTVRPGDDLWSISENVFDDGYKWVEIAKLNNLENPGLIQAGNKLKIPAAAPTIVQEKSASQAIEQVPQIQSTVVQNNSIIGNSYTVVAGDNLWDIAVRAYGDGFKWPDIAKANNLANPDLIFAGNVFNIPR